MSKLILDLRNNPGGYLVAAEAIADTFLSEEQAIVTVESNQGERETTYATSNGEFEDGLVYVLINGSQLQPARWWQVPCKTTIALGF